VAEPGAKTTTENELIFSLTNRTHFSHQHKTGQQVTEGWKTMRVWTNLLLVTPSIWRYSTLFNKSNAIELDGVLLKFLKLILPQVLGIVILIFNTILKTSMYLAAWKTDYRHISLLPSLSKAI
jgi:hypothetical protein